MNLLTFSTKKVCLIFFLLAGILFGGGINRLGAQDEAFQQSAAENVWPPIETYLDNPDADLLNYSVLEEVRKHCGKNYDCLYNTYDYLVDKFENRNEYWLAIPVVEEMLKLAQGQKDLKVEIKALEKLIELKLFIGEGPEGTKRLSDLLELYERMGDQASAIQTRVSILEGRIWNLGEIDEVLPILEDLREQAVRQNLTEAANRLLIRLKYIYEEFGYFDKLEKTIEALEAIQEPGADTITPGKAHYAFHAASGRADLLMRENNYAQAKSLYEKALAIARLRYRAQHDSWSEIYVLLRLAKLELKRNNTAAAKSVLDTAYLKSKENKIPERTAHVLAMQIQIAEDEKRYADALRMTRERYAINTKLDSFNEGFDLKKHHLQLETKQLMAEKEKQALSLRLKNSQLRNSFIIALLVSLLAIGLFIGLWKQRQGKQKLALQNQLIQQQAEQLKNLDAAKSHFFANVSHELRTPLTLMLGPVHTLLKDKQLSAKQVSLLKVTERSGKQLQQLIKEILDLRKLEMDKMEIDAHPTALNRFFMQHFAQFESLAENKQIDFSYQVFIDKEKVALIDQEKCRQILSNLLSNAFKFTPKGGQIKTAVKLDNAKLQLTVADTGPGIHPDDLPHLFDRYFQTNRPDKPAEGGTGIGLALCKEYAELFGGKVEVESTLGKGSMFMLRFPITLVDPQQAELKDEQRKNDDGRQITSENLAQVAPIKERAAGTPLRTAEGKIPKPVESGAELRPGILVVEDNPDLQDYIRLVLSEKYEVVTADNGRQALEYLGIHTPPPSFAKAPAHPGRAVRTSNIQHPASSIPAYARASAGRQHRPRSLRPHDARHGRLSTAGNTKIQ